MNRIITVLISVFITISVSGQSKTIKTDTSFVKPFKSRLIKNSLVVSTAAVLAFTLDKPMNNWMNDLSNSTGGGVADVANALGEKTIIIPALGATWGLSYLIKDDKLKRTSWNAIKTVAVTAIVTEGLKISAGRARPFTGEGPHSFHPFSNDDQYKSLPSGHTSVAFAVFTPFAETYSRWIYAAPASVALARMYKNKHWFSDVVVGGGIGFISGWIFTHYPQKNIQVTSNSVIVFF